MSRILGAFLLALCAASPASAERPVSHGAARVHRHPVSGLEVIPLTVIHGNRRHRFMVEVARTSAEQQKGLMFRTAMGADEGMIFPVDPPRMVAFWMRNTVIPLDIVFIGADGRIANIAAMAEPYSEKPLPSMGQAIGVLELNGGRAAQLGIAPGDRVRW